MERWEYDVVTLEADARNAEAFLRSKWPEQRFPQFASESLIPQLDDLGRQGWELVSAQPVTLGKNGDATYFPGMVAEQFTHTYLCFLKRRTGIDGR